MKKRSDEASINLAINLKNLCKDRGIYSTVLEQKIGYSGSVCSITIKRGTGLQLRTALDLCDAVHMDLNDMIKDPKEFRKEFINGKADRDRDPHFYRRDDFSENDGDRYGE